MEILVKCILSPSVPGQSDYLRGPRAHSPHQHSTRESLGHTRSLDPSKTYTECKSEVIYDKCRHVWLGPYGVIRVTWHCDIKLETASNFGQPLHE